MKILIISLFLLPLFFTAQAEENKYPEVTDSVPISGYLGEKTAGGENPYYEMAVSGKMADQVWSDAVESGVIPSKSREVGKNAPFEFIESIEVSTLLFRNWSCLRIEKYENFLQAASVLLLRLSPNIAGNTLCYSNLYY